MKDQIKIGQVIAGKYELIKALKETHLYQWIGAVNLKTQKAHTIQVILNECQKGQIKEVFDYFDALKNIRREGIIPPEQVISNNDLPLIIYPESFGITLDLSKDIDLELTLNYLSEASELLHIVNNKKLIHGQINPKSFILKDNKVYLSGFGYAPFLMQGNENAIKDCGDFLPPEITDANSAQKSKDTIDTYAFAKTVAYWFPNICTSAWYLQATNPDRNQRFKRMRNLFEELKKALTDAFANLTEINDNANQIEVTETEIKLEPQTSGGIIPKHILEIELEPPEAGRVEGGGKYAEGRQVNVKAIAFPDWEFIGWDGDIVQSNNSLDLVIEKNLKITARYKKAPKLRGSIQIEIYPSESQEFIRVSGVGDHPLGTSVEINAWSISDKWRFSRWTGDINVAKTPFTIALTSDIRVVAEFAIAPDLTKPKPSPKKLGNAFGQILSEETARISSSDLDMGNMDNTDTQCVNNEIPEVPQNKSNADEQTMQKQKKLGSAFINSQVEEEKLIQPDVKQSTKKPIVGSAFGESK
jgi:hypothetical protein